MRPEGGRPSLAQTTARLSILTAGTRLLGFARWVVFGVAVGTTYLGNAYQTAVWIPNILFELVAGGILASVFVPTFLSTLEESKKRAEEVASTMANLFLLASVPLVLAAMLLGRPIMSLLTAAVPDPAIRAQQIDVGATFLLFFAPQIPIYLLGMLMRGVLYAHNRVLLPAVAPAFGSALTILAYGGFYVLGPGADLDDVSRWQLVVLGAGTTLGVAAWAFVQLPQVRSLGLKWRPVLAVRDPAVRRALAAGGHGLVFTTLTQAGFLAILVLTNRVPGGVVAFQIAFAFYELPNAVAGFPISTASYPPLAQHALKGDRSAFGRLLSTSVRAQALLMMPAAALLVVLGVPVMEVIFGWEGAPQTSPELISAMLVWMVVGLPAFALLQMLVRGFWALDEMRAPGLANAVTVAVMVAGMTALTAILLPSGTRALAVVGGWHAIGQWAGVLVAFAILARLVPEWQSGRDALALLWMGLRAGIMGAAAWGLFQLLQGWGTVVAGVLAGLGAVALYVLLSARSPELRTGLDLMRSGADGQDG